MTHSQSALSCHVGPVLHGGHHGIVGWAPQPFLDSECLVYLVCHVDISVTLAERINFYEGLACYPQVTGGGTVGTSPH